MRLIVFRKSVFGNFDGVHQPGNTLFRAYGIGFEGLGVGG
ncbi:hypothetical protein TG4357_02270 [Thalassovita gelatinovora]|uniref:Uncharacterized protein n=1 Tax=Thalassovita gelatinovora TaxID=53501 RepID=A0A0N7LVF6_THAGE|nr:hypothetical protein TG4357_02270 [Thalassovita gelatinovora]